MCRVASYVVADYRRKELRRPPIISLNDDVEDGDGNTARCLSWSIRNLDYELTLS